ncbi:2-hydroxychromene-2-carboxylate isomerase [Piscinibacter sp. XHJ-5]|uniref:2-hydroxychromene-2-carboxylate isomerase n=1 Tax=Piscinibacter sp. XHJ-5 TaxID=3037797 RepID=UPI00245367CC|nr:2-hydroxychromene-2-carboxylate isomerase [Piscinibacter sp. XHJ-5]
MKHLTFHFDVVSPFAYLAFERLPQALEGLSYSVDYQPVLFAGLLSHWGQKGPAEIEPKRAWTFRHVHWLAHRHRIAMHTPAQHPFNPLALLRLALACAPPGRTPSRHVCEQALRHVWCGGGDANDPARLAALTAQLAPRLDPASDVVKQALKEATARAVAKGVFGVPTIEVDGRLFWGFDALEMVAAYLRGDPWFDGPAWDGAAVAPPGVTRKT